MYRVPGKPNIEAAVVQAAKRVPANPGSSTAATRTRRAGSPVHKGLPNENSAASRDLRAPGSREPVPRLSCLCKISEFKL